MPDYIEYRLKEVTTLGGEPKVYLIPTKRLPIGDVKCKFCGSRNLVRYGKYRGIQRYLCRDCNRKGADNDAMPGQQSSPDIIGAAISMFYEGMSFNGISRQLQQMYHVRVSATTLYRWVVRYSQKASKIASEVKLGKGKEWVVDETTVKVGRENLWFWDIIDSDSRFLIASHLSTGRTTRDAEAVMKKAQEKVEKPPDFIISDKLAAYLDGIERVFGADTFHVQSQGFRGRINTNLIERFHGTLKGRTKVMRGLKKRDTAKTILDGFLIHYNFFRPHQTLQGRTPAEVAGVQLPYDNWAEVVREGKKEWC